MVGVGKAAENGVLIRHGEALETAAKLKTIVLDKTAADRGKFELTDIVSFNGFEDSDLLLLAAVADRRSEHPLAKQLLVARAVEFDDWRTGIVQSNSCHGVEATVDGRKVLVGNAKLMRRHNVAIDEFVRVANLSLMLVKLLCLSPSMEAAAFWPSPTPSNQIRSRRSAHWKKWHRSDNADR